MNESEINLKEHQIPDGTTKATERVQALMVLNHGGRRTTKAFIWGKALTIGLKFLEENEMEIQNGNTKEIPYDYDDVPI